MTTACCRLLPGLCLPAVLFALTTLVTNNPTRADQPAGEGSATKQSQAQDEAADEEGFVSIFNGKDLTGWTPKFVGQELGVNYNNTFRVEDGAITVSYRDWDQPFNATFGHLFFETEYEHYILRLEYRFVGDQCPGGPGWAFRNSGIMFHGQTAESMGLNQNFPNSIEAQLLGQAEGAERDRPTGNVCTPGTHYYQEGKLVRAHCRSSTSDTFRGDQWVTFELEVHGHGQVIHRINGEVVFEYERPTLDQENTALSGGTISLQAESHPVQFRKIEIRELEPPAE
ncbi:MAG: DUF1080 domain-containing protein [Planctomycetota bacterium]